MAVTGAAAACYCVSIRGIGAHPFLTSISSSGNSDTTHNQAWQGCISATTTAIISQPYSQE